MKNLVIYENDLFEIVDIFSKKVENDELSYISFEKLDREMIIQNSYDNIFVFAREDFSFLSSKSFEIILFCSCEVAQAKINVILFYDTENGRDCVSKWINSVQTSEDEKLKLSLNVDFKNWKSSADKILNVITLKDSCESNSLKNENLIFQNNQKILSKNEINKFVTIYTDGACSGNPGAGGWGAVLIAGEKRKEISGFDPLTTNNKMELTAVIKALSMLKQQCNVELFSDSAYVVNAINLGWLENWKKNNFIGSDKKPVKNIELWKDLDELLSYHNVNFNKVKGHSDNELNNRCDELATGEIAKNLESK